MRGKFLGNRYRVQNRIGEGGMANVYVAIDEKLNRRVAIKVLHDHMAQNPDLRKRFFLEAQAISVLDHPNILKIFDFSGERSDHLWIVTEVLQGLNLNDYTTSFPGNWLHPILASCMVQEILRALSAAHRQDIIHRDVKPENIMVLNSGRVKLMDFGIAKNMQGHSITLTGTFMGSPSYMSPEQIRGKTVDQRSDLYSLGILFYEIITGRLPYSGSSTHDVVIKICEGKFQEPHKLVPNLPKDLNKIICKAMAKHPGHRYQEARTFSRDLDIFLTRHGFAESHIELERYFADRERFESRLKKLDFTNGGPKPDQSPGAKPKTTKQQPSTRVVSDEEIQRIKVQQHNLAAMQSPKIASSERRELPTGARRDHQIGARVAPPQFTKRSKPPQLINRHVATDIANQIPQTPGKLRPQRRRPRSPKRRHVVIHHYATPVVDPLSPILGLIMVAAIFGLSIWGFLQMKQATPAPKATPTLRPVPEEIKAPPKPASREKVAPTPSPKKLAEPRSIQTSSPKQPPRREKQRAPAVRELPQRRPATPVMRAPKPSTHPKPMITNAPAPKPSSVPAPVASQAFIRISAQPAAEIYLDGRRVGTTVDQTVNSGWIKTTNGNHRIELRRTGFKTISRRIKLDPNQRRNLGPFTLKKSGGTR